MAFEKDITLREELNIRVINQARKWNDLTPFKKEKVSCLRCDIKFETYRKRINRICPACSKEDKGREKYKKVSLFD